MLRLLSPPGSFPYDPRGGLVHVLARFSLPQRMCLLNVYGKLPSHRALIVQITAKLCAAKGALVLSGKLSFDFDRFKTEFVFHAQSLRQMAGGVLVNIQEEKHGSEGLANLQL
jgi:hypothetical protein